MELKKARRIDHSSPKAIRIIELYMQGIPKPKIMEQLKSDGVEVDDKEYNSITTNHRSKFKRATSSRR